MKKITIYFLTLLLSIFLCSCINKNNNQEELLNKDIQNLNVFDDLSKQDNNNKQNDITSAEKNISNQVSSSDHTVSDSVNIIAWGSYILGSYNKKENNWTSCSPLNDISPTTPITFGDILTKSSYYVFDEKQMIGEAKKIIFPQSTKYRLEDMNNSKALISLSEPNSKEDEHIYSLPVYLDYTPHNMPYPAQDLLISFVVDTKRTGTPDFNGNALILSDKGNPFPRNYTLTDKIPEETISKVNKLFSEHKISEIIPYYKYCYSGDFDADNDLEYLTIINNELGENYEIIVSSNTQTKETAFYNIIIYQDGNNIEILKNDWNTIPETEPTIKGKNKYYSQYYWSESNYSITSDVLIVDINNDSMYEFLIESSAPTNFLEAYSIINDSYQLILKSIFY